MKTIDEREEMYIAKRDAEAKVLERLSDLIHEQWVSWSKNIAERENLSPERMHRWEALWCPYGELTEEMKEADRVWARKMLKIIKDDHFERFDRVIGRR